MPFNVFKTFYGLQFYTSKLRVFKDPREPCSPLGYILWYILVARLENIIAPGRRASDFASPDFYLQWKISIIYILRIAIFPLRPNRFTVCIIVDDITL